MKFAHLADCHIGSWRDPKLRDSSLKAFVQAINKCIEEGVDFILIAGDLFNNALPSIDHLNMVVKKLKELKDIAIRVYAIEGSHDFSPSGKTIMKVLENAGLLTNPSGGSFINDKKTGANIYGIAGRKGGLEREAYTELPSEPEQAGGFRILMFHSAIEELKPSYLKEMQAIPLSMLPKNFGYYAGGHIHIIDKQEFPDYPIIAFPGPLFPNNFAELEQLGGGGFYIYEDGNIRYEHIRLYPVFPIRINCTSKTVDDIEDMLIEEIKNKEFLNTIITIRLFGCLRTGKPSDINFNDIFKILYDKSAYFVMRNTSRLASQELQDSTTEIHSVEEAEGSLINENAGKSNIFSQAAEKELVQKLIDALSTEKEEGQTNTIFEESVIADTDKIFDGLQGL